MRRGRVGLMGLLLRRLFIGEYGGGGGFFLAFFEVSIALGW